jgi:selenocysteine-specific elongation factor
LLSIAAPRAASAPELERRFGAEPGSIARALERAADAVPVEPGAWVAGSALQNLAAELVRILERFHAEHPHEPGASLETLRSSLITRSGRELAELVIAHAAKEGLIRVEHSIAYLPSFAARSTPGAQRAATRVADALRAAALQGATDAEVAERAGERPEVVRSTLQRLASQGSVRRLSNLWFSEDVLEALRARVRAHLGNKPAMTVPEFKDLAGVSRKQAIPLLEQLDREGTTRRQGDLRVLGAAAKSRG